MITPSTISAFQKYFQVVIADTPELKAAVYRIRYEVYCEELGFERAEDFPDRLEQDCFDDHSHHCLLRHRSTGAYAGCVRLVIPSPTDPQVQLPFEAPCAGSLHQELVSPIFNQRSLIGELSRLAIPEIFRRRSGENRTSLGNLETLELEPGLQRHFPFIPLGLYLACSAIGVMAGLNGVFAMMEPRLARHLRRFGIVFQQMGDVVDYHGPRAAYYISRETLLNHLEPEVKKLLHSYIAECNMDLRTGT